MEWTLLVFLAAGAGLLALALAVFVFLVGPGRSSNRALATFLVLFAMIRFTEALEIASGPLTGSGGGSWGASLWLVLGGYFWLVDDIALLYFVAVVAAGPGRTAHWGVLVAAIALAVFLLVAYSRDPALLIGGPAAPLLIVDFILTGIAYGILPVFLVWWTRRLEPGRVIPILLVSSGLAAWFMAYMVGAAVLLFFFGRFYWVPGATDTLSPGLGLFYTISKLVFLTAVMVLFGLLVQASRRGALQVRWAARVASILLLGAVLSGLAWGVLGGLRLGGGAVAALIMGWFLVGAFLLSYAVVRHQLFDIDLRLKWTIKRGTLVALFVGVFFVSAQVAQAFLVTEWGWAVGGVVAGLLLLAINPLQRFAGRVADTAMPRVEDSEEYRTVRKREVYQAALEEMLADGTVTTKERRALIRLQEQLDLDARTAQILEIAVIESRGVD